MAIYLEANYSKKLGLPGYSSHQYSVSLKTELTDPGQVQAESSRLYDLLQSCVDRDIQKTGFLPGGTPNGNTHHDALHPRTNGNGQGSASTPDTWACSPKQRALILKIIEEGSLDKNQVEALCHERFGKSVRALNKIQASELIYELQTHSENNNPADLRDRLNGRTTPSKTQ